jgi:hypothetical protein
MTFLLNNQHAMDSVKGVATWWLHCDESVAQAALDRLVECGLVSVHTLPSGPIYSLTRDPKLQRWLQTLAPTRAYLGASPVSVGNSASLMLVDLPVDTAHEEEIAATPIGDLLVDAFER